MKAPAWISGLEPVTALESLPTSSQPAPIKVLHVITKFRTGAGGNTLLTALGMDSARYEMWIAAAAGGELWERAERAGIRMVVLRRFRETISPVNDLIVLWQLVRLIRRERFSIVHTHASKGGFLGRMAARMCRTPVVVHGIHAFGFHEEMSRRRRGAYILLERIARRWTHAFIAVAPQVAREAVERRVASPGRIEVVPSSVELDEIPSGPHPNARLSLNIPPDVPLIGTVGRICQQKAPLDFVRMAAAVAKVRAEARFVMVGDGPMEEDVRREAELLGVEIMLPGFRSDAPWIAASFDVFVMPSLYEGLGRALTEALASGRPVVGTSVNGIPDLIVPGATGLLAPAKDPSELARCVLWMLDHPREAQAMGRQGQAAVRKLFHPSVMCRAIDATYGRLLGIPTEEVVEPETRIVVLPDTRAPMRRLTHHGS